MSDTVPERDMAPKRRRMMDMVLALGGLKEESAVPLSKVNEEIASLRDELSPLSEAILGFPVSYFGQLVAALDASGLVEEIRDKSLLSEAVSNVEAALTGLPIESFESLLVNLQSVQKRFEKKDEEEAPEVTVDLTATMSSISDLISELDTIIADHERKAESDAEAARSELDELTSELKRILSEEESDIAAVLDALQKLGTKTRYGPFLRTSAQVKRGIREGRITEDRSSKLVFENVIMELNRGIVMFILNKMGSKTVTQMADLMDVPSKIVQTAIISMLQRGDIEMVGLEEDAPVFSRVLASPPGSTLVIKQLGQQIRAMRNSVDDALASVVDESLARLESFHERLQILGEYDETPLSVPINSLREAIDAATEGLLSSAKSESADELRLLVSAGLEAFARFRLKITLEKGPNLVSGLNVYGEKLDAEKYEQIMSEYLDSELERGTLLVLIRELGALTAHDLAEKTNIPQDRVFRHLLRMKRDELLTTVGETHGYVLYDVPRTLTEAEIIVQTVCSLAAQLASAKSELEQILSDLKAEDIGRLAGSLEVFSKAHDRLTKLEIGGAIVAEDLLQSVEESIRSAILLTYRTRAKIPSTRAKVTIDDLLDVDVPSVLDEYREMMGYAPLLGFGTVNWDHSKCLGCKSCENSCPEDAIVLKPRIKIPQFFEFTTEAIEQLPSTKAMFYNTVRNLATKKPVEDIPLDSETPGFGSIEVDLWLCVACRTCVRICPGPEEGALELELKWSLPEIVRQISES
ncbi:MAG: 4Fe-4S dicluster domain-containing protein [Candidatus Thorarchaeota archaeon]|nr:MAG: 4Fe-4S dicluster domain-containing protein [Candidatus Thorarchaeota archaeon]